MTGFNRNVFKKYEGGPMGLGDPDDTFLSQPEKEVMLRRLIRERSSDEKCALEVAEFKACAQQNKYLMVLKCRPLTQTVKECLARWYNNEEFVNDCTQQYLRERSEYRRTGLSKQQREDQQKSANALA